MWLILRFTLLIPIILGGRLQCANVFSLQDPSHLKLLPQKKTSLRLEIKSVIASIHPSFLKDQIMGEVIKFYEERNYEPFWHVRNQWSIRAQYALNLIDKAGGEGLFPANYVQAKELVSQKGPFTLEQKAYNEIIFCHVVFRYLLDLTGNRFTLKELRHHTALAPSYETPSDLLIKKLREDDSCSWMEDFSIEIDEYQQLKSLLQKLREQQSQGKGWGMLDNGRPLKFGSKGPRIVQLRKILEAQGDFQGSLKSTIFDLELDAAVRNFQNRHGLKATGVVDNHTRKTLNKSLDEKIRTIIVTMERWRWLPSKLASRHVWVNIPSFRLLGIYNQNIEVDLPIIVGKFYRKTPVFFSYIHQIRFNPHWTAPRHIAIKDILPKIQEDPEYFNKKGFMLLSEDRTATIDPDTIDWSILSKDNFPYVLRQKAGEENALGRIRFSIKNPWQIYLHATPDVKLFENHKRMFSSGCVRVKSPEKLAAFVFNDSSRWTEPVILKMLNSEQRKFVELKTKTPVYIVYFTVWVKENIPYFVEDIYKKDESLDFLIHSMESKTFRLSPEDLKKPIRKEQFREMNQATANEIFEFASAASTTNSKS